MVIKQREKLVSALVSMRAGHSVRRKKVVHPTGEAPTDMRLGGATGKGFVRSDPRINRTKPGPGRPPKWWRDLFLTYEADAVHTLGKALTSSRKWRDRIQAANIILDRLHGKPIQPVEHVPAIDVSQLSTDELRTLDGLLSRVVVADGSGRSAGAG